jgi:hypothetical protein
MASGGKELVINPRERALSTDQNRAQKFMRKDLAELLRYWINVNANEETGADAVAGENPGPNTPMVGEILGGIMARPQIGNTNVFIDPGVMLAISPDGGADDSNYKYIHDAGTTTPGALTIAANASGSVRIDFIEVQVNNAVVVETASRDIFNTSSGLFAAATVTKATADQLNYRVSQGTPGGGFPLIAQGWMQICVAIVPNGSVNNDTVTFYDVRPLISDRAWGPSNLVSGLPTQGRCSIINAITPSATTGYFEAQYNGRRLGGRLRRGSPGAEFPASTSLIDLTDANNQSNPFTITNGAPWFLYLLTPQGLPRWARYTDAASGSRIPRGPKGIPIITHTKPFTDGTPSLPIHMPAVFGFTSFIQVGVCVAAGYFSGGAVKGVYGDADGQILVNSVSSGGPIEIAGSNVSAAGFATSTFDLTSGTHFPANARQLLVDIRADISSDAATQKVRQNLKVFAPNAAGTQIYMGHETSFPYPNGNNVNASGAQAGNIAMSRWIPIAPIYPNQADFTQRIAVDYDSDGSMNPYGAGGSHLRILGWKF